MKLFYIQSPYYWSNLYSIAEKMNIEAYELLVENPVWPTAEYDETSTANKIRLWNEEKYGSNSTPQNKPEYGVCLGEDIVDGSWLGDMIDEYHGVYTEKIKAKLNKGDDVILAVTNASKRMIEFFRAIQSEYDLRLHYIVWRDFNTRVEDDTLLVRYLPYINTAASVVICNSHEFCNPYVISFETRELEANINWEKETKECNELFLETAKDYLQFVIDNFETSKEVEAVKGELHIYEFGTGKIKKIRADETEYVETLSFLGRESFEAVTPGLGHDNCIKLREYRQAFKEKYDVNPSLHYYRAPAAFIHKKNEIDERKCEYRSTCRGVCVACDNISEALFEESTLSNSFAHYDLVKDNVLFAPINGIDRMRVDIDGNGVRSLVIMDTCYLNCKYCINKKNINRFPLINNISVMELAATMKKDIPYFEQSGGGVTFGGGEPLIYGDFIHQFHEYAPQISINIETSLNVEKKSIENLINDVDEWIVDIKDMNPEIYFKYTDTYNEQVINNLTYLLQHIDPNRIRCRVPLIQNYNTETDIVKSINQLMNMGITRIERFEYK